MSNPSIQPEIEARLVALRAELAPIQRKEEALWSQIEALDKQREALVVEWNPHFRQKNAIQAKITALESL
jgi:chromosome segregation ATPase